MEKIKLIDETGVEKEYDVVISYIDEQTKKGYLVYTDGVTKFLASFDPNSPSLDLNNVDNEEEINKIKDIMKQVGV